MSLTNPLMRLRDRPEHVDNTLLPDSKKNPSRPWVVPMVCKLDGKLTIKNFDERPNAMAFIEGHSPLNRDWPEDFDRAFPAWQMGAGINV